jgi:glycosyltransferase 2 family protein
VHAPALDHGALPRPLTRLGPVHRWRAGRWLGWLLVALSFWFVGARLWQAAPWDLLRARLEPLLLVVTAGALIYGLAGFLLSAAWRRILAAEHPPGPAAGYHAIYGRSQIAKYLPGNCFHFIGRQLLGGALGHSQAALALASLAETALLIALAAALALPLALARLGAWSVALAAGALVIPVLMLAAPRLLPAPLRLAATEGRYRRAAGALLGAVALHGAFFAIAGGVLWLLAAALGGPGAVALAPWTGVSALALAWVAGFVVPGAAAGAGIREAVLIVALEGALGTQASAAIALALRLVTTMGDGVFFGLALALPMPARRPPVVALGARSESKLEI